MRDSDVIESALRGYLGLDLFETVWERNTDLDPDEALQVAYDEVSAYVQYLRSHATLVTDPPEEHGHCRDRDDDYLVTLARAARVAVLVSGDADLVDISDARPPFVTPRALVETLERMPR